MTGSSGSTRPNIMTSQENIYVVLILQGRRGLLLELQQARERAPRPHEVFGAVQATSDRLDILMNNAGIGTASPRQTSAEEFETEPWKFSADGLAIEIRRDDRVLYDSPLEESGFELVWGFSCQVVVLGFAESSLSGAGKPFFIPSPAIRFPERAEGVKGPKR